MVFILVNPGGVTEDFLVSQAEPLCLRRGIIGPEGEIKNEEKLDRLFVTEHLNFLWNCILGRDSKYGIREKDGSSWLPLRS